MRLRVEPATTATRSAMEALFQLYVYDFSEMVGEDVEEDGRFAAPALKGIWDDARNLPFLVRVDDRLAGLAVVHRGSHLTGEPGVWDMAQFFVMRKYRRKAVGAGAAHHLFAAHHGPWEVRQIPSNTAATAFWRRVIDDFADHWTETTLEGDGWCGTVQRFTSPGRSR